MTDRASLLVELRVEELPARGLRNLGDTFSQHIRDALVKLGLVAADAPMRAFATPRRLAIHLADVAAMQPEQRIERKGPAVASGIKDGKPTPALAGFAKSCGVPIESLERASDGKAEYFVFRSTKPGQPLAEHLGAVVGAAIKALPTPKLMRWGATDYQFTRPVRGLMMLWGKQILAGEIMGCKSGRRTEGHRFLGERSLDITDADSYEATLRERGRVIVDFAARVQSIGDQLRAKAGSAQLADESLIEEVAALVELPAVVEGSFDPAFLEVPQECLMLTMKANQKYFPLLDGNGKLLPRFLVVSNMAIADTTHIVRGNERVLRARLSDAKFFFDQDRRRKLEELLPGLAQVVFHNKLGSQADRARRIEHLAEVIAGLLDADTQAARRAAHLAKADLLSGMVGEFPELQGTMGMYYARHDGESPAVADAIEAHYRPRFAGDRLPDSPVGDCVALADKLDTIIGIYGIGLGPTGDKDPFGLRRAALGVLRILSEHARPLDVYELLRLARDGYGNTPLDPNVIDNVFEFMIDRLRSYLRERGAAADEIEAVVAIDARRIDRIAPRLDAVRAFRRLPEAESLASANKRIANILKKSGSAEQVSSALLVEAEERSLYAGVERLEPAVESQLRQARYAEALQALAGVRADVDAFFDRVLVNAEDPQVRTNRLGLLTRLNRLMNRVADISKLAG